MYCVHSVTHDLHLGTFFFSRYGTPVWPRPVIKAYQCAPVADGWGC